MKPDDYLDEDEERDRFSTGSIFASGWFRAVLVLGVLAITLVVTVPYLLRWMDPAPARIERQAVRPVEPPSVAAPVPIPAPPPPVPAPVGPAVATPPTTTWTAVRPTPAPAPPAAAPTPVSPPAQATAPAPRPAAPAVASPQITERMVPAPAPAPAPSTAERESKPAKPSVAEADSRTGDPAAKKAAPVEGTPAKKATQTESAVAKKAAPADGAKVAAPGGDYWVQVGVFQREDNAETLARSVREKTKMPARISNRQARSSVPTVTPARHEVFVSGAQVTTVNAALKGRGSAHAVRGGVAVQPPLELKEAVALSQRLSGEGMNVKIRRIGGEGVAAAGPGVAYVVRVGGYGTRAQAEAAKRELARKGVNGFVTPVSTAAAR